MKITTNLKVAIPHL